MSSPQEDTLVDTDAHTTASSAQESNRSEPPAPSPTDFGALDTVSDQESERLEPPDSSSDDAAPNSMASDPMDTLTDPGAQDMASDEVNTLADPSVQDMASDPVNELADPSVQDRASDPVNALGDPGIQNMTSDEESTDTDTNSMASGHQADHLGLPYLYDPQPGAPRVPGLHAQSVVLSRVNLLSREVAQGLIDFAAGVTSRVLIPNVRLTYRYSGGPRDAIGAGPAPHRAEHNAAQDTTTPNPTIIRESPGYAAYIRRYLRDGNGVQNVDFHDCVSCFEISTEDHSLLPCGHSICRVCLNNQMFCATRSMGQFPPQCCFRALDVEALQDHLHADVIRRFNDVVEEYSDRSRFFCANKYCSAYINTRSLQQAQGKFVMCHKCGQETCKECKQGADVHHCKTLDEQMAPADRQLIEELGYKRCPTCGTLCERERGCPQMPCPCGQAFCIICGDKWPDHGMCNCLPLEIPRGRTIGVNATLGPREGPFDRSIGARPNFRQTYGGGPVPPLQPGTTFAEQRIRLTPDRQHQFRERAQAAREEASRGELARNQARFYAANSGVNVRSSRPARLPYPTVAETPAAGPAREIARQWQDLQNRIQRLWQNANSREERNRPRSVPDELREAERNVQFWEEFFGNGRRLGAHAATRQRASNQPVPSTPNVSPVVSPPRPVPGSSANESGSAFLNPRQAPTPPRGGSRVTRRASTEQTMRSADGSPGSATHAESDAHNNRTRFGWLRSFRSMARLREGDNATLGSAHGTREDPTRRSHEEPLPTRPGDLEADQPENPDTNVSSRTFGWWPQRRIQRKTE
ncbi:hypothetical protein RBB50_011932 [Rhinocladiella similis]